MALNKRCADRVCTVVDVRWLLRRSRYYRSIRQHNVRQTITYWRPPAALCYARDKGKPHLPSLFGEYHADLQAGQEWKLGTAKGIVVRERAAEGLQYGSVTIAHEGGKRGRSSRVTLGQVWWYLFAFDLVNLLASPLGLASSGGTAADSSGSGSSSMMVVRRSPKQTMHDSAMLGGC
jgi:hypothetical protein